MLLNKLVKTNKNIFEVITEDIKTLLKNSPRESCILFGAGTGGVNVYSFICKNIENGDKKIKCFVDNNPSKLNTYFCGKKVFLPANVFEHGSEEAVIISCGEGDEIIKQLRKYFIPLERIYIPDISALEANDADFIEENIEYFNKLYEILDDEKSRNVLVGILNYKLSHKINYISEIADEAVEQYFDRNLIKYNQKDIFVDCGGYIGDTIESYVKHNKGVYDKIICLEADQDNYNIIKELRNEYRIELYNMAAYNCATILHFDKIGSGSGTILEEKVAKANDVIVEGTTIDTILKNRKVSFIKMDIEGAEYKTLLGAVNTIQKHKPTLMISVYHKQDDLIKIPLLIKSLNYKYKLYLRHYRSLSVQETVLYAINMDN